MLFTRFQIPSYITSTDVRQEGRFMASNCALKKENLIQIFIDHTKNDRHNFSTLHYQFKDTRSKCCWSSHSINPFLIMYLCYNRSNTTVAKVPIYLCCCSEEKKIKNANWPRNTITAAASQSWFSWWKSNNNNNNKR